MESRISEAIAKKASGKYNCAQAVACSYCDMAGIDPETMRHTANAFGTGMGCLEGTCGALVGAGMILGLVRKDRIQAMKDMKLIMTRFHERNGATVCKELKGIATGRPLRECNGCVADAAELLETLLAQAD